MYTFNIICIFVIYFCFFQSFCIACNNIITLFNDIYNFFDNFYAFIIKLSSPNTNDGHIFLYMFNILCCILNLAFCFYLECYCSSNKSNTCLISFIHLNDTYTTCLKTRLNKHTIFIEKNIQTFIKHYTNCLKLLTNH